MTKFIIVLFCLVCVGCAMTTQDFEPVDVLVTVRVHVVRSYAELPRDAQALFPRLRACAYRSGDVWVVGRQTGKGIDIDSFVLGHEIQHLLNWYSDGQIINPDRK